MNWYVFGGFAFVGLSIGTLSLTACLWYGYLFAWHSLIKLIDQIIWTTLPFFYYVIFPLFSLIRLFRNQIERKDSI